MSSAMTIENPFLLTLLGYKDVRSGQK
jgi:hypothetical protein